MPEQRRYKRFEMRLPIRVLRTGMRGLAASGETRNLSSGGVLFFSDSQIEAGETIEYTIDLEREQLEPVSLRCLGKVTRSQAGDAGEPCEVAATLQRYEFVRVR